MKHCKYYLLWAVVANTFSQEEINDACVNNEKRTIKQCAFCEDRRCECPEFEEE